MEFNEETAAIFLRYLKALVSMGVPLNDVARRWSEYVRYSSLCFVL